MFRNAAITFLLFLFFCSATQAQQNADLIITGGHYFDVETGTMIANQGIAVSGDRFLSIGIDPKDVEAEKTIHSRMTNLSCLG